MWLQFWIWASINRWKLWWFTTKAWITWKITDWLHSIRSGTMAINVAHSQTVSFVGVEMITHCLLICFLSQTKGIFPTPLDFGGTRRILEALGCAGNIKNSAILKKASDSDQARVPAAIFVLQPRIRPWRARAAGSGHWRLVFQGELLRNCIWSRPGRGKIFLSFYIPDIFCIFVDCTIARKFGHARYI